MIYIVFLLFEIFILFRLSKSITESFYGIIYLFIKDRKKSLFVLSVIFLPGTFIHEVSHFIAALLLGVPVGEINLIPEISDDGGVKMGSVPIAKTDPIRRMIVGVAPFILGMGIISISTYLRVFDMMPEGIIADIILLYIVFQVANTMFSSKQDVKGILEFSFVFLIIIGALFLSELYFNLGILDFFVTNSNVLEEFTANFSLLFLPVVAIDTAVFLISNFAVRRLWGKLKK